MDIKALTIEELEDRIIDGDEDSIRELVRRYREGDGVSIDKKMALTYEQMLSENDNKDEAIENDELNEDIAREDERTISDSTDSEITYNTNQNLIEECSKMRGLPSSFLREKARQNNLAALVVLAEKYLASTNLSEKKEGLETLTEAEAILRSELTRNESAKTRDSLAMVFNIKGEHFEQQYRISNDPLLGEKAFEAYSNANELDSRQTYGLARCYREGIGVERNLYKANDYEEQSAINGGINERYSVAIEAKERGETIRTIEWLQIALAANDVNNHLALKGLIRFMLSNYNEVDEAGQQINMQEELNNLESLASSGDPEAAYYLADTVENKEEKLKYYRIGASNQPGEYTEKCKQKIYEIEAESEGGCKEEETTESERLNREAIIAEEIEKKTREERALKKKRLIIKAIIIAGIAIAVLVGIVNIANAIKIKQEEAELVGMNITLERNVKIRDNAYSVDNLGNKVLTIDNNTTDVELKTQNPKINVISTEDWEALVKNYVVSLSSKPEGIMKNGIEVTIKTAPKSQRIIDRFNKKYGCNVTEKSRTHKFKTNGFTNNITSGAEFMDEKGDVLEYMKRVCCEETNNSSRLKDASMTGAYYMLPSVQDENYSNSKVVIITHYTGIWYGETYGAFIFDGPFGDGYTEDTVSADEATFCSVNKYDMEAKWYIEDEINDKLYREDVTWRYEWQKMD